MIKMKVVRIKQVVLKGAFGLIELNTTLDWHTYMSWYLHMDGRAVNRLETLTILCQGHNPRLSGSHGFKTLTGISY